MSVRIAGEALNSCSGCEISLLDMGERLIELLEKVRIVHLPLLMDSKHEGTKDTPELPKADIGFVSGSINTREHRKLAKAMRKSCTFIVALGTCATHGGIPALANSYENRQIENCFLTGRTTDAAQAFPSETIPELLPACTALDENIKVDYFLAGCPPHPDHIFNLITALEKKEDYFPPDRSVCDNCPATREGKGRIPDFKSPLELPEWKTLWEEDSSKRLRCFLEQGFLCMGPVTLDGCGGDKDKARCITAGVPCRGCYGPLQHRGNQRLALLSALASNGINLDTLPETQSLLRFSGAHGLLRPISRNKGI